MKATRRTTVVTATVGTLAIVLSACGGGSSGGGTSGSGSSSGGQAAGTGQVVFGESTDFPENLFPLISAGNATSVANIEIRLFPEPFQIHPDFTIQADPEFMDGEPTLDTVDGKQVNVYKINPDAVWSDGEPITADDFAFTWNIEKSSDPANGGCDSLLSTTGYDQIDSVEGTDNGKTVTVTYATPYSDWQSLFTIFPKHILEASDPAAQCTAITNGWPIADGIPSDISGGPWQLKKENINADTQVVTLTPNANYWGNKPKLAQLVYQNVGSDPGVQVSGLQNGELGVVYPQPQLDLVGQIKALEPNVTNETNFGLSWEHFDFNTAVPALAKPEVRQAIALGLDRAALTSATVGQFDDRAQALNNRLIFNNQPGYVDNSGDLGKQDQARAEQLLQQAGYTKGADGIYADANGPLELQLMTTQNNPLREQTIDVATSQLGQVGIKIDKFLNADIFAGADKPTSLEARGFQIALYAWVGSPFLSPSKSIFQTTGGQNYTGGSNTQVDDLFDQLSAEPDRDKQVDLANQIDTLLWQDMFTLPLYQKPTFLAYDSSIDGVGDNPTQAGPLWNSETWSVKS